MEEFQEFDRLVLARLAELLEAARGELPTEFTVYAYKRWYTDSPVAIYVDPVEPTPPANCERVFSEMNVALEREFVQHKCYFGLSLHVPHKYLNYQEHLQQLSQQDLDNDRFRKIRLKEEEHG